MEATIDRITHQTQSLSWDGLPSKLQSNEEKAKIASSLVLIGILVAKKALNKPSLLEMIRKVWDFATEFSIEDLKNNKSIQIQKQDWERLYCLIRSLEHQRPSNNFKGMALGLHHWGNWPFKSLILGPIVRYASLHCLFVQYYLDW